MILLTRALLRGLLESEFNGNLGPIHMHKIYTCKYFASWSKYTHLSKSIFNLRSHANSVHISILQGTQTCCTADMYRLPCYLCTGLAIRLSHQTLMGQKSNLMCGGRMLLKWHLLMINGKE